MKRLFYIALVLLWSCEDQIEPTLRDAPPVLVIDAFLNDLDSTQMVRITESQAYFDNTSLQGITGAEVRVARSSGSDLVFVDQGDGTYHWQPADTDKLGTVGDDFILTVIIDGSEYRSFSRMNRVPNIDSVTFRFEEENLFLPDSYFAEFWSRDPLGTGDTYWIKSYKNGIFLNQPNELNIAFDAGFSEGGNVDGLIFIPPVRDAINPFVEDENDEFMSPFEDGDSVYVEIHSISNEAFDFLNEVRTQTDRPGGFAELFATPLSNVSSNIEYIGEGPSGPVLGFFSVSAVTGLGKTLDISQVPKGN
ncbi:MAG: DUF4249 domain-containing protein [Cyclobacteriaceae bacterium]|nr:DUF4249 domain-containing protein [Cyclobacteriaceae bacterium]